MIKDFIKQINNKNIYVATIKNNKLEIVKEGINSYLVSFKSKENKNNWCINCSVYTISLILKTWQSDRKLIKKYSIFEW